jgi:raffinose/stachyose/melibiose transport system substrate-binding protein
MQVIWSEGGSLSPVDGVEADIDPKLQEMADLLANADAMVPPPDTTYPVAVATAYYQAAAFAASGEKTAEDALAWLDQTIADMGTP